MSPLPAEPPAAVSAAPAPAPARPSASRLAMRVAAGLALLGLVIWYADPRALWQELRGANPWWFVLAVVVATAANFVAAARWAIIARGLGLLAPYDRLVRMYARGITTNIVLPGATLSGDLLRSVQLSRLGNPFGASALSVFLDRVSGLWMLCGLSLLSACGLTAWKAATGGGPNLSLQELMLYVVVLATVVALPLIPLPFARLERSQRRWIAGLATYWERLERAVLQARPALLSSVWRAFGVQFLSTSTLWICGLCVGVTLPYPVMLAAAAPIFVTASLPIGIGGFGTREVAAVVILGMAGVAGEQAVATSLLYGLASVVQGILAAPLFFTRT